jgi:hypothetical protein
MKRMPLQSMVFPMRCQSYLRAFLCDKECSAGAEQAKTLSWHLVDAKIFHDNIILYDKRFTATINRCGVILMSSKGLLNGEPGFNVERCVSLIVTWRMTSFSHVLIGLTMVGHCKNIIMTMR